jgi:hypothetical protein
MAIGRDEPVSPGGRMRGQLLRELDAELQRRFLDTSRGFGARRVMTAAPSPHRLPTHRFFPENDVERELLGRLETVRVDVVFYLGGPSLVHQPIATTPPGPSAPPTSLARPLTLELAAGLPWRPRPPLQGPVMVVNTGGLEPPAAEMLLADGRRSFVALATEDVVEFRRNGWAMVARPVRASNESCVACHNGNPDRPRTSDGTPVTYKVRDVLGVLLYALQSGDESLR